MIWSVLDWTINRFAKKSKKRRREPICQSKLHIEQLEYRRMLSIGGNLVVDDIGGAPGMILDGSDYPGVIGMLEPVEQKYYTNSAEQLYIYSEPVVGGTRVGSFSTYPVCLTVEADLTLGAGASNNDCITLRTHVNGVAQDYAVTLRWKTYETPRLQLERNTATTWSTPIDVPYSFSRGTPVHLKIVNNNGVISVYANNVLQGTWTDPSPLPAGSVAFSTYRIDGTVDNVVIKDSSDTTLVDEDFGDPVTYGWGTPPMYVLKDQITSPSFSEVGMHLYYGDAAGYFWTLWTDYDTYDWTSIDSYLDRLADEDPDGQMLLRIRLDAPEWWLDDHPTHEMIGGTNGTTYTGWVSYSSQEWMDDTANFLRALIKHLEVSENGYRVVGLVPTCGQGGEWVYSFGTVDEYGYLAPCYSDYSPVQLAAFREWLAAKYGANAALQEAWNDASVTLANATIPTPARRAEGDYYEFFDPAEGRQVPDYLRFHSEVISNAILHFAAVIKDESPNMFVDFFYGYHFPQYVHYHDMGHNDLAALLDSPYIDAISSLHSYTTRGAGGHTLPMLYDSVGLHGKVWINEDDTRTYLTPNTPIYTEYGWCEDAWESVNELKRNIGYFLSKSASVWYQDFNGGWYTDPDIMEVISDNYDIMEASLSEDRTSASEIVVVVSEQSLDYMRSSFGIPRTLYQLLYKNIGYIGAPFDTIDICDLADAPDYKFYIFLDTYYLTDTQRDIIDAKVKHNGNVALWLWGDGFVTDEGLSYLAMSDLVDMEISDYDCGLTSLPLTITDTGHPITDGIALNTTYELYEGDEAGPTFVCNDGMSDGVYVLGETTDSLPGLVVKESCSEYDWDYDWDEGGALEAMWHMDERQGSVLYDFAGSGYDGDISGATWSDSGIAGACLEFDGSGDGVDFGDVLDMGTSDFSLELWFKSDYADYNDVLVEKVESGDPYYLLSLWGDVVRVRLSNGPNQDMVYGSTDVVDGQWHHIVAVYDRTNSKLYLYVDGVLDGQADIVNTPKSLSISNQGSFRLGGSAIWGQVSGSMDEVKVYTKALNAEEIETHYEKTTDGWTSVWVGTPNLPVEMLRNMAKLAGVHIYVDEDVPVYANKFMVTVAADNAGTRTINLPAAARVIDAYTGDEISSSTTSFDVSFLEGETRMFWTTATAEDNLPPVVSTWTLTDDTGVSATDRITKDTTPVLTFTFSEAVNGRDDDVRVLSPNSTRILPDSVTGWGTDTLTLAFSTALLVDGQYTVTLIGTSAITDIAHNALNNGTDEVVHFILDATSPTLTWGTPTPPANAAGWNNTDVTLPYTVDDAFSVVDSSVPPSPLVLSSEGISVTGTVTVADMAGNSAHFTSPAFKIDKTAPIPVSSMPSTAGPTDANSLTFIVIMDEAVSNVTVDDFQLAKTGTATGKVVDVDVSSGTVFTVTVNAIWGDGMLRLDLKGGTDSQDAAGNTASAYTAGDTISVVSTTVAARHVFYNNSYFDNPANGKSDDDAIATDKIALLPGQKATFSNYTSYTLGINGIMIDFDHLPGTLTVDDFEFRVGNDDAPDYWLAAPIPQISESRQVGGVYRTTITWANNAIQKTWLQVTVKANENTGLVQNDVFYFGNAVGESGDNPTNAIVNSSDEIGARQNPHTPANRAAVNDVYDYNRDSLVNSSDQVTPRSNSTTPVTALKLIAVPLLVATDDVGAMVEDSPKSIAVLSNERDANGNALSVYHVDSISSLGASLTINPNNTFNNNSSVSAALQALMAGQSLWDTFNYTIRDSHRRTNTATTKVLVSGLEEPSGGEGMLLATGKKNSTASPSTLAVSNQRTAKIFAAHDTALVSEVSRSSLGYLSWHNFDLLRNGNQKSKKGIANTLAVDAVLRSFTI